MSILSQEYQFVTKPRRRDVEKAILSPIPLLTPGIFFIQKIQKYRSTSRNVQSDSFSGNSYINFSFLQRRHRILRSKLTIRWYLFLENYLELSDCFEKFESNKVSSLLFWTFLKIRQYRTWILSCFLQFTKLHSSIRIEVQIYIK